MNASGFIRNSLPKNKPLTRSGKRLVSLLICVLGVVGFVGQAPRSLPAAEQNGTPIRRVNAPYTTADSDSLPVPERAVFWFGQVGPIDDNYVDARVIYNDEQLVVTLHVFDRLLFYKKNPSTAELTEWDAATLYLNLGGNSGSAPGVNAHQFAAQLNWNESRDGGGYEAAYRGNGVGWEPAATVFSTSDGWQGTGFNNTAVDDGWNISFRIPFDSLGLAGKPPEGTVWDLALAVHDRDDAGGTFIADKIWPESMTATTPSTWGQIHFGLPVYEAPPTTPGGAVTVRHGLNGAVVADGHVGGDTICAQDIWPDFWSEWGSLNYSSGDPQKRMNIQNQWNLGDWPCFSKYFTMFPLDAVPANRTIISATLTLYQFGNSNQGGVYNPDDPPEPSLIQVLTTTEAWDEATLTWNTAPLAVENVSRAWIDPLPAGPPWLDVPRQWDVSLAVARAYEAGEPLRLALYSADNGKHSGKYFRSSDIENETLRPSLEIVWGYDQGFTMSVTPLVQRMGPGDTAVFQVDVQPTDGSITSAEVEVGDPYADLPVSPRTQTLSSLPDTAVFSATDLHSPAFASSVWYTIPVTVTGGTAVQTTNVKILLNGSQVFLPATLRGDN
ncbi:MAG: DNRLRE domain-containing protein [Chloroflexi bacterium]|nr:DNRLRE domain-containing protein [Chloroflexota bacterium]